MKAWVALQAPFAGAAIADWALAAPDKSRVSGLQAPGRVALTDMTPRAREAYHKAHAQEIGAVLRQVPTLCYGSFLDQRPARRT